MESLKGYVEKCCFTTYYGLYLYPVVSNKHSGPLEGLKIRGGDWYGNTKTIAVPVEREILKSGREARRTDMKVEIFM